MPCRSNVGRVGIDIPYFKFGVGDFPVETFNQPHPIKVAPAGNVQNTIRVVSVDVKDHVSDVQNAVPMGVFFVDVKDHMSTFRIPSLISRMVSGDVKDPTFRIPVLCVCGR